MINTFFDKWKDSFPEIADLQSVEKDFAAKKERWKNQAQTLSIGIMGQVKAGKSSFLNALLFNGEPILPEAATPKTANLTKISYGEQFSLSIEYYSQTEWQQIITTSQDGSDNTEVKVAKELVTMAEQLPQQELLRCLAVQKEVINHTTLADLQGILNQYTGNDGSHTPLVKSTEITLPYPELKGYEVVDTPGMNDPVASRTQKTREYMANCDVVFFLSRCGQFLDKSDDILLRDQLPSKGVKRLVLVACQYDSVIQDDGYDRSSLAETEQNIKMRIMRVAKTKTDEWIKNKYREHDKLVESIAHPIFASSFAYGFACWPSEKWTKTMIHNFNDLTELAKDNWNYCFTQEDWLRIGNFDALTQQFAQAKADSETLLAEQKRDIIPQYQNNMKSGLNNLAKKVLQHIDFLVNKEIADIDHIRKAYQDRISNIASVLNQQLTQTSDNAKQQAAQLINQLEKDQQHFNQLSTRTGSRSERYSYQVSDSTWYNPFSWGSTRTVYDYHTVSYNYLNSNDAIEQINQYAQESTQQIVSTFNNLISPNTLKVELKKALLSSLDTKSADFDPVLFRTLLENALSKLTLPVFDIQLGDTTSLISQNFTKEVTSSDKIEQLKAQLASSLNAILKQLQYEFERQFTPLISKLDVIGKSLKETLTKNIQQELEKMQQEVANKEQEITHYKQLLSDVDQLKDHLQSSVGLQG